MSRRNNFQIFRDILAVADGGAIKTRIIYQANLNFKIIVHYMDDLMVNGLIILDHSGRYHTTNRGRAFIQRMANTEDFLNESQGVVING